MNRVEELRENVAALFQRKAALTKRVTFWIKLLLLVFGAFVATSASFFSADGLFPLTTQKILGLTGGSLVLLGSIYLLITEEDTTEALDEARRAADEAVNLALKSEVIYQISLENEEAAARLYSLYMMMSIARGTVEQAVADNHSGEDQLIRASLSSVASEMKHALGLGFQDIWTICVYRAEQHQDGHKELRLIAHDRPFDCSISDARRWKEGVGVGGIAYAKNDEVIAPNLDDPAVGTVFKLDEAQMKPEDREKYKSVVAVPITVGNDAAPWGVVLATSDTPDYFGSIEYVGVPPEEAVRALAGVVAVAVAVCRSNGAATRAAQVT